MNREYVGVAIGVFEGIYIFLKKSKKIVFTLVLLYNQLQVIWKHKGINNMACASGFGFRIFMIHFDALGGI